MLAGIPFLMIPQLVSPIQDNFQPYRAKYVQSELTRDVTPAVPTFPDRTKIVQEQRAQAEREAAQRAEAERQAQLASQQAQAAQTQPIVATVAVNGTCASWIAAAGVTDVTNAMILINRESGCNPNAVNRSSGACGIPQALPCSKLGTSDPVAQILWMQNYVFARYGSWANAVAFHNSHGWY